MATSSQRKASMAHRRRAIAKGFLRIEVQAGQNDVSMIRALAETLRGDSAKAEAVRAAVQNALGQDQIKSAFDIFGSDLPDDAFDGVFDQVRDDKWREIDL